MASELVTTLDTVFPCNVERFIVRIPPYNYFLPAIFHKYHSLIRQLCTSNNTNCVLSNRHIHDVAVVLTRKISASRKKSFSRFSNDCEFCSSRTQDKGKNPVNAMTTIYIKKPYSKPECKAIDRTDLAVLIRNKLLKHREAEIHQMRTKGIRSVLLVEDSRNRIGNIEQNGELNGTKCTHKELVNGS